MIKKLVLLSLIVTGSAYSMDDPFKEAAQRLIASSTNNPVAATVLALAVPTTCWLFYCLTNPQQLGKICANVAIAIAENVVGKK